MPDERAATRPSVRGQPGDSSGQAQGGGLRVRSQQAERMETDCTAYEDYARCLTDLAKVNVVTMTHRPVLAWLKEETRELQGFSLCDVGCGQGDLLRLIARQAYGRAVRLEGVDRHPWSIRAAREATSARMPITYREADVFGLPDEVRWDFIVSSQFAHHLTDEELIRFMQWQDRHAVRGWFISDLHRHWFAYYGFPLLARVMSWHRFVRMDGQVSIARGFTVAELREALREARVPDDAAAATWHVPFRICVARRCGSR
jgi:2-polyprenyl-3-methyl-5-hydroxy-6-metoxy-1,4-benzoquinol methylase